MSSRVDIVAKRTSQTRAALSLDVVTIRFPSGLNAGKIHSAGVTTQYRGIGSPHDDRVSHDPAPFAIRHTGREPGRTLFVLSEYPLGLNCQRPSRASRMRSAPLPDFRLKQ
jgi:hypothetical protein